MTVVKYRSNIIIKKPGYIFMARRKLVRSGKSSTRKKVGLGSFRRRKRSAVGAARRISSASVKPARRRRSSLKRAVVRGARVGGAASSLRRRTRRGVKRRARRSVRRSK